MLKNAQSRDVTLYVIPGGFHEVMMGSEREDVSHHIIDWICEKVGELAAASPTEASSHVDPSASTMQLSPSMLSSDDTSVGSCSGEELHEGSEGQQQQQLPQLSQLRAGHSTRMETVQSPRQAPPAAPVVVASAIA